MNQDCEGYAFEVDGIPYWRCLKDGTIIRAVEQHILRCPHCGRFRADREPVLVEVRTLQRIRFPNRAEWGWFEIPSEQ
jgi:ABC-type ATPase with predicted acetyltransferase domain